MTRRNQGAGGRGGVLLLAGVALLLGACESESGGGDCEAGTIWGEAQGACVSPYDCQEDGDCAEVADEGADCCTCAGYGVSRAVNREHVTAWNDHLSCPSEPQCLGGDRCTHAGLGCRDGTCVFLDAGGNTLGIRDPAP